MTGLALVTGGSHADVVARALAFAGLVVAAVSVALNAYQWRRSGPALTVKLNVLDQTVERAVGLEYEWELVGASLTNSGRMPAIVGGAWLVPTRLTDSGGTIWLLRPADGEFPVTIPPTGFCVLALSLDDKPSCWRNGEMQVQAVVFRGDGRQFRSSAKKVSAYGPLPDGAYAPRQQSR